MPGGLKEEIAAAIPEWIRVGWRAQSQALLDSGGDLQLARQQDILTEFLSESYFGGWYHKSVSIRIYARFSLNYALFGQQCSYHLLCGLFVILHC